MAPTIDNLLDIAELAESILLFLDFQQLFAIQRVSRQLQATIRGSLALKRKMYLCQAPQPTDSKTVDVTMVNPLLRGELCIPLLPDLEFTDWFPDAARGGESLQTIIHGYVSQQDLANAKAFVAAPRNARASWTDMKLTSVSISITMLVCPHCTYSNHEEQMTPRIEKMHFYSDHNLGDVVRALARLAERR